MAEENLFNSYESVSDQVVNYKFIHYFYFSTVLWSVCLEISLPDTSIQNRSFLGKYLL